ncbi:MAG: sulfatase atsG [Planctomycetaceae bacterium]|nr:sulfatase atsG [Planctomycetaceae bacterium]
MHRTCCLLIVLAVVLVIGFLSDPLLADDRPNLLLFLADDMTYTDLGCYGNPDVKTPFLDQLATEGVRFTRCYNTAPTCSPLRQSLYTGIYPIRNGAYPNHSRVYDGVKSLPHHLKPLDYRTAIVGKRHEAPASAFAFEMLGGSHGDGGKTLDGEDLPLEKARDFMSRDKKQPWCLVVASNQPHTPWNRGDASAYPPNKLTVPPYLVDTPELREGLSDYYAEITYMDGQVGQVLSYLKELKQAENTVVLWLSEQGSQLPFGKWTCYDTGVHAAAILRWPSKISGGKTSEALLSYVDVVPTFVELAGGQPNDLGFDGRSFVDLMRGKTDKHNDVVFSTHTTRGIARGSEAFAIRSATDGRWLYVRNLHSHAEFQNVITHKNAIFFSWKEVDNEFARLRVAAYIKRPSEELFDLKTDPWCIKNLANQKATATIQAKLSQRMNQWMKQQGDLGDATERAAESRQPKEKPWSKRGVYSRLSSRSGNE